MRRLPLLLPPAAALLALFLGVGGGCLVDPVCQGDADCASGHCDEATGRCTDDECVRDEDCGQGFVCRSGLCEPGGTEPIECPEDMAAIADTYCIDVHEASRPDATATSAGLDSSRATSRAGVLPWRVTSNAEAQAACAAAGRDLCTEVEWQTACVGSQKLAYAYGNLYDPLRCNGIDTYCDCVSGDCAERDPCPFAGCYYACGADFRLEPTGAFPGCTNDFGVFDMNGNVWEHVRGGDATRVRGGAYNCSDSKLFQRCDYIPGSWEPSALGFRCCWRPGGE